MKHCRYSKNQLRSLGYGSAIPFEHLNIDLSKNVDAVSMVDIAKGKFANIIDVLYTSTDGSLDNSIMQYVNEDAPASVKSFVQNVLMVDVPALQSAPDDETAFNMILPRSISSSRELEPYVDYIKSLVSDARSSHETVTPPTSE